MKQAPAFLLDQLVAHAAQRTPGAPAVRIGKERLNYRELEERVARVAAGLVAAGVQPQERVGIYQPKSLDTVVALLAILRAGGTYVPIDPQAPAKRAQAAMVHAGVRTLFSAGRPFKQLSATSEPVVHTVIVPQDCTVPAHVAQCGLRFSTLLTDNPAVQVDRTGQDLAYLLYTSGSTGTPKGVAISHAQSLAFVQPATEVFGFHGDDVVASHAPFNFDLSVIDLFCTFSAGAEVVLIPETWLGFPAKVADLIERAPITVWNSVPSALVAMVQRGKLDERDLHKLRTVLFAGEPFPLPALRALRAAAPETRLINVYGQTEANSSTYHVISEIPEDDSTPLPIGRALPNYRVLLLSDDGEQVSEPGQDGQMYIVSPAVACGYLGDETRTSAAFVQHPLQNERRQIVYRTGDRARLDEQGRLTFLGRADLAIKVRGFRVELGEIEAIARREATVQDACAAPVPDAETGHQIVLFVSTAPGQAVDEDSLRKHLADALPRYMRPERIACRASLPQSSNGKIDRAGLRREAQDILQNN